MLCKLVIHLRGVVQGVGMRPALCRMAEHFHLTGHVQNTARGVELALYGPEALLEEAWRELPRHLPEAAHPDAVERSKMLQTTSAPERFTILDEPAAGTLAANLAALPDAAPCPDCRRELHDPSDRRFQFAFNGCDKCGVRASAIAALPYRRAATAWADFPLCEDCRSEYEKMSDRRFHIEGISCPKCGPHLRLTDGAGRVLAENGDALTLAAQKLRDGAIAALKGVGGFQLLADPSCAEAVTRLRRKKHRPHQPLALLARDEAAVKAWTQATPAELAALASPAAPIVLLAWRPDRETARFHPEFIAPDGPDEAGFMLPASPLHLLLMEHLESPFVIATSGNDSGLPPACDNATAQRELAAIADFFLLHDRPILWRHDDSLAAQNAGEVRLWRRARGYAWQLPPVRGLLRPVLAAGTELKNAFAAAGREWTLLSPCHGRLESAPALDAWSDALRRTLKLLPEAPQAVACDLHPDYLASHFARGLAQELGLPPVAVPHHYAHALAALAEFDLDEALALVCDGTGLGPDGTLWGGELLYVSRSGGARLGFFQPVPLPGGDAAVREPFRQWAGRCFAAQAEFPERLAAGREQAVPILRKQCETGLNAPLSSAAGRLFDAFASSLGLADGAVTYEGQAAVRLESRARQEVESDGILPFAAQIRAGRRVILWDELFRHDWTRTMRSPARAFHRAVAAALADLARYGLGQHPGVPVLLTGGVMQNRLLVEELRKTAPELDLRLPTRIPVNDGGIAIGQIVWAGLHFAPDGVDYKVCS